MSRQRRPGSLRVDPLILSFFAYSLMVIVQRDQSSNPEKQEKIITKTQRPQEDKTQ